MTPGGRRHAGRVAAAALAVAGLLALAAWALARREAVMPPSVPPATAARLQDRAAPLAPPAAVAVDATSSPGRSTADFARWLATQSSLRGVALDGDWGVDAGGALRPSLALRRRFDMLLLLSGEAPVDAVERFIAAEVEAATGRPDTAAAVLALWRRYVALQQHRYAEAAVPDRPETWAPALAEHQRVRRELLGVAVADVFYRDDDAAMQARIAAAAADRSRSAGAPTATPPSALPPLIDRASLTDDARRRLDDEIAAQARWAERLAVAQAQVAALQAAPELSPVQRAAAVERWIVEHFDPAERRRARALLGMPGP